MKPQFISVSILLTLGNLCNCNGNLFSPSSSSKRTELELVEEVQPPSGLRGRARKHRNKVASTATTESDGVKDTPHELTHHEYMKQHQLKHHRGRRGGGAAARRRKKNQNQKNGNKPKRQRPNKNKKGKNKPNGRQVSNVYVICILCISYVHNRGIFCLSYAHVSSPSPNQLLTSGRKEEQQTRQREE